MNTFYTYRYPRPAVTTDCVILGLLPDDIQILLIRRGGDPYRGHWALPGGFLDMDETAEQCAARELTEETGLRDIPLLQVGTFSGIDRDPRGRTLSVGFVAVVPRDSVHPAAGDDAAATAWHPLHHLPPLAFDHHLVVTSAISRLREHLCWLHHVDDTSTYPLPPLELLNLINKTTALWTNE